MRAFIAVVPPPAVRKELYRAASVLRETGLPVRWVDEDALHITLVFLGQLADDRTGDIASALADATAAHEPFDLTLAGLGAFPRPTDARVVWAGVRAGAAPMTRLQAVVAGRLAELGFPREERAFSPHITLGRARRDARGVKLPEARFELDATFRVEEIALMRSHLSPRGARYERVDGAALGAPAAREA